MVQSNDDWFFLVQEDLMLTKLLITISLLDRIDLNMKLVVKLVDGEDVLFVLPMDHRSLILPLFVRWIVKQVHVFESVHRV